MLAIYRNAIVVCMFTTLVTAWGADLKCPSTGCGVINVGGKKFCYECSYPLPVPKNENGIAIYLRGDKGEIANELNKVITNVAKGFSPEIIKPKQEHKNLMDVFAAARFADQQLVLIGFVSESGGKVWISAQFFDVETAYMLASGTSYYDTGGGGKTLKEAVKEIVRVLPLRGRWSEESTFEFINLPTNFPVEEGGRLEVVSGYSYDLKKLEEVKYPLSDFGMWLGLVEPKLVTIDPTAYDISKGPSGQTQLKIKETGGVQFKKYDICYYYPPPETATNGKKPIQMEVERRWFFYLGGAYLRHGYNYVKIGESREDVGSAELRLGYHTPWNWPIDLTGGYAVNIPYRYKYDYVPGYQAQGRIMGAYISSVNGAADFVLSKYTASFIPWFAVRLGLETGYFFASGDGVFEHSDGRERYDNGLWNGFLMGPRAALGFNFGSRNQYELAGGVSYSCSLGGNYHEHFGGLWRFPLGVRCYF